jgi:alkylation response protein AidB-like acyl-CoA dehydrogenase
MTATESAEQALFASTTQAFLEKQASLRTVRDLHAAGQSFDPAWWRQAAELGWTSFLVGEDHGGGSVSGDGVADLALVAEMAGRTVAPGPLHPVSVVLAGLVDADNRAEHAAHIDSLMAGEAVASWAVYEPGRPFEPLLPTLTATATAAGYRLRGVKDRVEAAAESDLLVVVAQCSGVVRQFAVPTDAPGIRIEPTPSIDMVKHYARVRFDDVDVTAGAAVGGAQQTAALIDRQTQIALILQCAELVGMLDTMFAATIAWALDRHSFGRQLASYQALKHRFADLKTRLEACRATTAHAVSEVGARSPEADVSASIAKSFVGEWASVMLQDCIQLHGGIGLTWEHDLHLFLRRAALYRALYGSPDQHNRRIFTRMTESKVAQ